VEAPWHFYFHDFAYLQRIHRQHVVIGFVGDADAPARDGEVGAHDDDIRLRRAVRLDDREGLRARSISYVVLHRDIRTEMRWVTGITETPIDMAHWESLYRCWFGPPIFDDGTIVVFDVVTARAMGSPGENDPATPDACAGDSSGSPSH
jgi:hypothetical protein